MILDTIGIIFWYGILATPVIAFLIVWRFPSLTKGQKLFQGILITILLAILFFAISISLVLRNGLGPA